jgi:citrate lyase subunit beta / citryl-CoA lyase
MNKNSRPRRSLLYMPGSNERALEKGKTLAADGLILDLEDAVAPDSKINAREQIARALQEGGYGKREIVVRVNSLDSQWGEDDLKMVATIGADAILLPKVESKDDVLRAESILNESGGAENLPLWCMMETPLGILHAEEVAFSSSRIGCLVLGTSDLAKDLNAHHTSNRIPFLTSLELCILAGKAAGVSVLDGVHLDLQDDEGFKSSCVQGKELGMDGKTLIHPKTIDDANKIFSPSQSELAWAKLVIEAHLDAQKKGQGIVLLDGKLIENLHVESAKRLMIVADSIKELEKNAKQ